MRNRNVIEAEVSKLEAEISKLKAELSYVIEYEHAVYILNSLGWTHKDGKWVESAVKCGSDDMRAIDADKMTNIKAGDYCTSNIDGDIWYVRKVEGTNIWCSRVTLVDATHTVAECARHKVNHKILRVDDLNNYMGYRKSPF